MDPDVMKTALKSCELFKNLADTQMALLIAAARPRKFSAGETIYEKDDDSGGTFALIDTGRVNVIAKNGAIVNELGVGEIIGEVGVIGQHDKRTVTITTVEPTGILEWQAKNFEDGFPELLKRLKELAWKRMKYWNE